MASTDEYQQIVARMRSTARVLRRSIVRGAGVPQAAAAYLEAVQQYRIAVFGRSEPPRRLDHIPDHDLERYHLGMVTDEAELARLEEHLLSCPECVDQAEQMADYVDAMRAAIVADGEQQLPFVSPE